MSYTLQMVDMLAHINILFNLLKTIRYIIFVLLLFLSFR
jgi:hypothetical protein